MADNLKKLVSMVKKQSDKTQIKITLMKSSLYVPHLRIVVEPKKVIDTKQSLFGPYLFDLSSKLIPISDFSTNLKMSVLVKDAKIIFPKRGISKAFDYCIRDAKKQMKRTYYSSKLKNLKSSDIDFIKKENHDFLKIENKHNFELIEFKMQKEISLVQKKIEKNNDSISKLRLKLSKQKAGRAIRKVFGNKRLAKTTMELKDFEKRIVQMKKENKKFKEKISKIKRKFYSKKVKLEDKIFVKARKSIDKKKYMPTRKDLIVHSTILLIPKRKSIK